MKESKPKIWRRPPVILLDSARSKHITSAAGFPTTPALVAPTRTALATRPPSAPTRGALSRETVRKGLECAALVSTLTQSREMILIVHLLLVTIACGATTSENCTYFESQGSETGACRAKICKCDSNICQVTLNGF